MMPVLGENSASRHSSSGSSACTSSRDSVSKSSTPFSSARAAIAFNCFACAGEVATTSLPQRRCGTPCVSQKSYSRSRPCKHSEAFSDPRG